MPEKKDAVVVLDTDSHVLTRMQNAFDQHLPGVVSVFVNFSTYIRWETIQKMISESEAQFRLLIVDPSRTSFSANFNLTNGIGNVSFLLEFQKLHTGARVVLFTDGFTPDMIQEVLEGRLICHYEFKNRENFGMSKYWLSFAEKVRKMLDGDYAGNVQAPNGDYALEFIRLWIRSLPEGRNQEVIGFDGKRIRAGQILDDSAIFWKFSQAILSGTVGRKVDRALALAGQGGII